MGGAEPALKPPTGEFAKFRRRLGVLILQTIELCLRAGAFWISTRIHGIIQVSVLATVPSDWIFAAKLLHGGVFVGYAAIYVGLLYEQVAVFLPFLKPFHKPKGDE